MSEKMSPKNRACLLASHLILECAQLQQVLTEFQMFGDRPETGDGPVKRVHHNLTDAKVEWNHVQARANDFFVFVNQYHAEL